MTDSDSRNSLDSGGQPAARGRIKLGRSQVVKKAPVARRTFPGWPLVQREDRPIPVRIKVRPEVFNRLFKAGFVDPRATFEVHGVLWGEVYEGDGEVRYEIEISDFEPTMSVEASMVRVKVTQDGLVAAEEVMKERMEALGAPGKVVGWVHTHPGHGIFFSQHDLEDVHRPQYAFEDWYIGLVIDPWRGTAGFFFWEAEDERVMDCEEGHSWREFDIYTAAGRERPSEDEDIEDRVTDDGEVSGEEFEPVEPERKAGPPQEAARAKDGGADMPTPRGSGEIDMSASGVVASPTSQPKPRPPAPRMEPAPPGRRDGPSMPPSDAMPRPGGGSGEEAVSGAPAQPRRRDRSKGRVISSQAMKSPKPAPAGSRTRRRKKGIPIGAILVVGITLLALAGIVTGGVLWSRRGGPVLADGEITREGWEDLPAELPADGQDVRTLQGDTGQQGGHAEQTQGKPPTEDDETGDTPDGTSDEVLEPDGPQQGTVELKGDGVAPIDSTFRILGYSITLEEVGGDEMEQVCPGVTDGEVCFRSDTPVTFGLMLFRDGRTPVMLSSGLFVNGGWALRTKEGRAEQFEDGEWRAVQLENVAVKSLREYKTQIGAYCASDPGVCFGSQSKVRFVR